MFELLLIAITIIGSFAAGIYDLKTTNIPDVLCIAMIIAGLSIHSVSGFLTGDYTNLINSLMVGGLFLAFGLVMYLTGQWGGGDGELLVAMGVLIPTLPMVRTFLPFSLSFFVNSFFIGAIYSIIYSLVLAYQDPNISKNFVKSITQPFVLTTSAVFFTLAVISFFYFKALSVIFLLTFVLVIFWKFSKSIERGFVKRIPVSKLKVDDMIGEDIPKLRLYKRFIKGLTKEQVAKIKRTKRYVTIKEGIRYGLAFPLALVFTLLFGDFVILLF